MKCLQQRTGSRAHRLCGLLMVTAPLVFGAPPKPELALEIRVGNPFAQASQPDERPWRTFSRNARNQCQVALKPVSLPWARTLPSLFGDHLEGAVTTFAHPLPEIPDLYGQWVSERNVSIPIFQERFQLYRLRTTRSSSELQTLAIVRSSIPRVIAESIPTEIRIARVNSHGSLYRMLMAGRVDAALANEREFDRYVRDNAEQASVRKVWAESRESPVYLVFPRDFYVANEARMECLMRLTLHRAHRRSADS